MMRLRSILPAFLLLLTSLALSECEQKPTPKTTKPAALPAPQHGDARELVTHSDPPGEPVTARSIVVALREEMLNNSAVENPDHIFTHLLQVYHHSGLDLAQAQLRQGKDAGLRLAADTLRHRSQRNLKQLEALDLSQHRPGADFRATSASQTRALQKAIQRVRRTLATSVEAGTADEEFAAFTSLFYKSGSLLAQAELQYGREARQKTLARQWLAAQKREQQALDTWQKATRATPKQP
ncbi:DUF305 domain-containing protein [Hymenobacter sp. BT635]|uniref:DUF305 domain-containing protein n=1 Tax=Hymenobacter nitidus TaxID=2880929 RepID=A0ABS8AJ16_9BACT|nr:DUF305 domain-containing protein [Hymenobacter nitidus]MCB2380290.1 DUF305 domain-containing protein [Hymenobacter nitidus]